MLPGKTTFNRVSKSEGVPANMAHPESRSVPKLDVILTRGKTRMKDLSFMLNNPRWHDSS